MMQPKITSDKFMFDKSDAHHYDLLMAAKTLKGIAGASRLPPPVFPDSSLRAKIAALMAKKTVSPARNGGSPTPLEE